MSKKLIRPTDIEEAQINAAAIADPDNPPLTDNELQKSWNNSEQQATAGKLASMTH